MSAHTATSADDTAVHVDAVVWATGRLTADDAQPQRRTELGAVTATPAVFPA
ncbi:hypothetical protein [Blastococcus sp. SYSU DS0539]